MSDTNGGFLSPVSWAERFCAPAASNPKRGREVRISGFSWPGRIAPAKQVKESRRWYEALG